MLNQILLKGEKAVRLTLNVSERFPPAAGLAEFSRLTQRGWDFLKHVEEIKDK